MGQYEGIAAAMAEYLDTWLLAVGEPPQPHPGRAYAALELLLTLKEGAEIECLARHRSARSREAGIGAGVISSLPGRYASLEDAEKALETHVKCFERFVAGAVQKTDVDLEDVRALQRFFTGLQYRARQAAQADMAAAERSTRSHWHR